MVDKMNKGITLTRQCELVGINKSTLYYERRPMNQEDIEWMNRIDKLFTQRPYYGARRIQKSLSTPQERVNIKRIRRLMRRMGLLAIYPKRNLSKPAPHHKKYPYLLRGLSIPKPNHVWSIDITYIKMKYGFMYLTAVIDWYSRYVLSWKISNTMTIEFCKDCLQEAIDNFGSPEIFNSDQGGQFTSESFTGIWKENNLDDVKISMDGRGRATDNAFIERLWRSVKYEDIFLKDYSDGASLWIGLSEYFNFYNNQRLHQGLSYKTPAEIYRPTVINKITLINKEKRSKKEMIITTVPLMNKSQLTFREA